jgi:hypothetical protein
VYKELAVYNTLPHHYTMDIENVAATLSMAEDKVKESSETELLVHDKEK